MFNKRLILGLWEIGGYPFFDNFKEDKSISLIRHAIHKGIKIFDTAPAYGFGRSEKILGKAIKNDREKLIISTKCGLRWKQEKLSSFYKDSSKESIMEEIDLSLKRLNTDYIDIYFIHWPDVNTDFKETAEALNILKQKGKIKHIGLSNFNLAQINEIKQHLEFDYLQGELNILDQENFELVENFISNNKYFFAYSPLARGLLTNNYKKVLQSEEPAIKRKILKLDKTKYNEIIMQLEKNSKKLQLTFAQYAVKYLLEKNKNIIPILGTTNKKHFDEIFEIS